MIGIPPVFTALVLCLCVGAGLTHLRANQTPVAGKSASAPSAAHVIERSLDSTAQLVASDVSMEVTTHSGRKSVRLVNQATPAGPAIAVVQGTDLQDGTIDVDVAGSPRSEGPAAARGFIGIAFRVGTNPEEYECFYLRPTNGRADDQLRRNHSTQYISPPEFDFDRFRREAPGVYESYVDLVPNAWTHMRVHVEGRSAQLFVNGASQPTLIVNDLKRAPRSGPVALWNGNWTEGHFSRLRVERVR
ncbi:MAG TPA: hypothetical protein VNZ26_23250 [Vicinamibacterales bacterium]|nr:hypothetical protein [Vicinamibacterales bacterium]